MLVSFLNAEGFDTSFILYAPSGDQLARSTFMDFFGQVGRIGPIELPETGIYSFALRAEGNFSLTAFPIFPINIPIGQTATVEFTPEVPFQFFSFEAGSVENVDVVVDTGDSLPLVASVLNPQTFAIANSIPEEEGIQDPELTFIEMNSPEPHYIMLSSYDPSAVLEGEVNVTVRESQRIRLTDEPLMVELNTEESDRGDAEIEFDAQAGDIVRFIVTIETAAEGAEPYIEVRQGDFLLGAMNQSGLQSYIMTFDVPEDGPVVADIQAFVETVMSLSIDIISPESD